MLGLIRDWYRLARYRARLELSLARTQEALVSNEGRVIEPFTVLEEQRGPTVNVDLAIARDTARSMVTRYAHARNILNQFVNFTVGAGFKITVNDAELQALWLDLQRQQRWHRRWYLSAFRLFRDGEVFLRRFDNEVRFVEPELVDEAGVFNLPEDTEVLQGVVYRANDVETVVGYTIDGEFVPVDEVYHWKLPQIDFAQVRGWPFLYDARNIIAEYERWLATRAALNRLRAAFVLFRKRRFGRANKIQGLQQRLRDGTLTTASGKTESYSVIAPGTIVDHDDSVEYEFKSPNINAGDAIDDGRALALQIAVWFSLPEFWATGDASNANFASTAVAENPGIIAMRTFQEQLSGDIQNIVRWLLNAPDADVSVVFPNLIVRDEAKRVESDIKLHEVGAMSLHTLRQRNGLDPEVEQAQLAAEVDNG